ncbi:unnamed protein product [Fusarium equiseti]|uniref:Uncharacterized protein n=1 Tax=Fusarium equiseti TaxID=61235 RepID=A0A8J2NH75_FUSEQ|nr:unnamed protein product [Fusarium equiseti]
MMHSNNSRRCASNNRPRMFPGMSKYKKQKMEMPWRRPTDDDTGKPAQIREPPQTSAPGITQKPGVGQRVLNDWHTLEARVPGNTPDSDPTLLQRHTLNNLQKQLAKQKVIKDYYMWEKQQRVPLSPVQIWVHEMRRLHYSGDLLCTEEEFEKGHPVKTILKRGET